MFNPIKRITSLLRFMNPAFSQFWLTKSKQTAIIATFLNIGKEIFEKEFRE